MKHKTILRAILSDNHRFPRFVDLLCSTSITFYIPCQAHSVEYWLATGVPARKFVLGISLYGYCYTLDDISQNGIMAPATPLQFAQFNEVSREV